MKIDLYQINENPVSTMRIVPGSKARDWMDKTPYKFAYRCLPLSMANCTGWDVFAPCDFVVSWNGEPGLEDVQINYADDQMTFGGCSFGCGILTMHTGYIIKTDSAWDIMCSGPVNNGIPWASPLTGIIETSWLNFTFTINWQINKPGTYTFDSRHPVARLTPLPHTYDDIETSMQMLSDDKKIKAEYEIWSRDRSKKIQDMENTFATNSDTGQVKLGVPKTHWEKTYYTGKDKYGNHVPGHNIKREFPPFKKED